MLFNDIKFLQEAHGRLKFLVVIEMSCDGAVCFRCLFDVISHGE